jgi:hypothetical protein
MEPGALQLDIMSPVAFSSVALLCINKRKVNGTIKSVGSFINQ